MKYLIILLLLSSCYTQKKAMDQVLKADAKYPGIVATLARDKYPCTVLLKTDTTTLYEDSLVFIECPDSNYSPNDYANVILRTDTIRLAGSTVKVPVKIMVPSKVVTRWYEDSAKIKLAAIAAEQCNKQVTVLRADVDRYRGRSEHRGKENWIWRIIATVLIVWQAVKLVKRFV